MSNVTQMSHVPHIFSHAEVMARHDLRDEPLFAVCENAALVDFQHVRITPHHLLMRVT